MTTVLALRALGLGDLLTAVPALRGLRRGSDRLLLAAPATLGPLAVLTGAVDRVLDTPSFAADPPAGALRPDEPVDLAVNLHGQGPESTALLRTAGAAKLLSYGVSAEWRPEEHEVARWCRLVTHAGFAADPTELGLRRPSAPSPAPGAVVVHPGAAHAARRWPAQRWIRVAAALRAQGHRVVVTGSADEADLAAGVAAGAGVRSLAGRTDVVTLAALVAGAELVVCGDTGIAHLASAYARPSVVLFGPTSPARWGPPKNPRHVVLWAGQLGNPAAAAPFSGLLALQPDEVLAGCRSVLALAVPERGEG